MTFNFYLYQIETLTNTSVGSGNENIGIVDLLIQRDPVTNVPIIQSSSLKGSLKENVEKRLDDSIIEQVFGMEENSPGKVFFHEARLLALPLRSNKKVFYYGTSPFLILDCLETLEELGVAEKSKIDKWKEVLEKYNKCESFDFNGDRKEFLLLSQDNEENLQVEDFNKYKNMDAEDAKNLQDFFTQVNLDKNTVALFRNEVFKEICEFNIPVIARNKIGENGISEGLFYEEVLPRRTKLWFLLGVPTQEQEKKAEESPQSETLNSQKSDLIASFDTFEGEIIKNLIQIGGNASIGYGITKISKLNVGEKMEVHNEQT